MPFEPGDARGLSPSPRVCARPDSTPVLQQFDRRLRGWFAELMGGQSPWAAMQAWEDWFFHLSVSPGEQLDLGRRWIEALCSVGATSDPSAVWAFGPQNGDRRFRSEKWRQWPFNVAAQLQLAAEDQWRRAVSETRGVAGHHARRVEFMGQFLLNAMAPVNFAATNPEVIDQALRTLGWNFVGGAALLAEDAGRLASGGRLKGMEDWRVGETMALTEGKIVFRNALMELIQYTPTTKFVKREPILIVPAWIMKFYILDLTPESSLVRHLVDQGFTVFIISWKNPGRELADTDFEDYRQKGVMAAFDEIARAAPGEKVHAVGYCLGGTTLAIAAAAMARDGDDRILSVTLLAAQTDFEEAGELLLFIDESQLSLLEDMMLIDGYLDARRMAGAFYALRANEMLFSKLVERYLLGQPSAPSALDAWLADPTRMPARMHSEYLRRLFMENHFAHGDYEVAGKAVALKDIRAPVFALGAERDHIAPWRSVYKVELYGATDTTFVLSGGGHNSSVVSPIGKRGAYYWTSVCREGSDYTDPDIWLKSAERKDGSWWPIWVDWLTAKSSKRMIRARSPAANPTLGAAPGRYVYEA